MMEGIRPDAGVYPGFVGLNGRDVRSGGDPTSFSKRPPSNPGELSTPLKIPRRAYPIPGTTTQPTINGSTTLTRIVEPVAGDWEKLAFMTEGDLVFVARPEAPQYTSSGEDLADICTLKYLNDLLAKEENWLEMKHFKKMNYVDRGSYGIQVVVSKKGGNPLPTLVINDDELQKTDRNHPLLVYVPDGIARVVDPEGTNFHGELRTHLVYNVVAQGCCTVNNSTQRAMRADGTVQLTSEQIFDLKPEMNSALYLCLQLKQTRERSKFRVEYVCVSGANLRRVSSIYKTQKASDATPYQKAVAEMQLKQLNRTPMLQVSSRINGDRTTSGMLETNNYNEILRTFATTVRMWRIGRVIDARAQPGSTSVIDTFSPAIEAYIDIARVTLPDVAQVYMHFQENYANVARWFLTDIIENKSIVTDFKTKSKTTKRLEINAEYDGEDEILVDAGLGKTGGPSSTEHAPVTIGAGLGKTDGTPPAHVSPSTESAPVDKELLDKTKQSLGVHREWIDLLEASIPSMARPQFQTVVDEYKRCVQSFEKSLDKPSADELHRAYDHVCARARDSIEGSVQSAEINSARLKKAYETLTLAPLLVKATGDVHAALVTSIKELQNATKQPVHAASKTASPSDAQKLDMSSFHAAHFRTEHLIRCVSRLVQCDSTSFKAEYSKICADLKIKELPLEEVYAPTLESSTYALAYSASQASQAQSASSSDDDGLLVGHPGEPPNKPRKRTPPRANHGSKMDQV